MLKIIELWYAGMSYYTRIYYNQTKMFKKKFINYYWTLYHYHFVTQL